MHDFEDYPCLTCYPVNRKEYEDQKLRNKLDWIGQVMKNMKGTDDENKVIKEAEKKFEDYYPKYRSGR